ncbi:MAG: hypothetical protein AAGC46_08375 [Solirubrobacteraceae bacterium]|nr:hypothetical protein [Patulibacter sp.]
MLVAIDVDSTLHDYWEQFSAAAMALHGVDLPYADQHQWSVDSLTREQVKAVVSATHDDERIAEAVAYDGAAAVIAGWKDAGHDILITTHRRAAAYAATAAWLEAQGIPFDQLRCGYEKVDHCREVGVGLLIDDAPENLENALAQGIAVATIRHPWNASLLRATPEITYADDWSRLGRALAPFLGPTHKGDRPVT